MSDVEALKKLIPMAEAARMAGMPRETFRRRMHKLNYFADGKLLVPRGNGQRKKHTLVDAEVLKWVIAQAPKEQEHDVETLRAELVEIKNLLIDEKRKRIKFERTVRRWLFGKRFPTVPHETIQQEPI